MANSAVFRLISPRVTKMPSWHSPAVPRPARSHNCAAMADWSCEFCQGQSKRPRASIGARRCTSDAAPWFCRSKLKAKRIQETADRASDNPRIKRAKVEMQAQPAGYAAIIAVKQCFQINAVHGVSSFDLASIAGDDSLLRNGIQVDHHEHHYLVRGMFGDHKKDSLIPGTRWVTLRELCAGGGAKHFDKLAEFDAALAEEMRLVREKLLRKDAEAEAAEAAEVEAENETGTPQP
jgi:hypothetical protein